MLKNQYLISCEFQKEKIKSNTYPFNLPILDFVNKISFHKNVTFITWDNWVWKSSLLEAIAIKFWLNPEGGTKNSNFSTKNTHTDLDEIIKLYKWVKYPKDSFFLRSESFYNLATYLDDIGGNQSYWFKSLHNQSHWESFLSVFINRFSWEWIYFLDEPESPLSPEKQMTLLTIIDDLVNKNSQFIIITHSPILLSYPNSKIYEISTNSIQEILYKETKVYQLYKLFLDNPELLLKKLEILKK